MKIIPCKFICILLVLNTGLLFSFYFFKQEKQKVSFYNLESTAKIDHVKVNTSSLFPACVYLVELESGDIVVCGLSSNLYLSRILAEKKDIGGVSVYIRNYDEKSFEIVGEVDQKIAIIAYYKYF